MSFGKADTPTPPNYAPIAQADAAVAQKQFQLGQDQLDWGKSQFGQVWPYAQQYLTSQLATNDTERNAADQQQNFYNATYRPIEAGFANDASTYASPERAEQRAGMAMGDVANAFDANRNTALQNLESYGIDPSQTRFGALDLGTRVSQAAATAAAGTQSRLNTDATGLALKGEAINIGRGYPGAIANAYGTATNAGSAGLGGANSTTTTGANTMGTPTQYNALGLAGLSNQASALNTGFGNQYQAAAMTNQNAANTASGIGKLIGGGLGAAMMFA